MHVVLCSQHQTSVDNAVSPSGQGGTSGARYTADRIQDEGKGEAFMELIEELYPDGIDRTALNDLMWFDSDWIYESLGMNPEE